MPGGRDDDEMTQVGGPSGTLVRQSPVRSTDKTDMHDETGGETGGETGPAETASGPQAGKAVRRGRGNKKQKKEPEPSYLKQMAIFEGAMTKTAAWHDFRTLKRTDGGHEVVTTIAMRPDRTWTTSKHEVDLKIANELVPQTRDVLADEGHDTTYVGSLAGGACSMKRIRGLVHDKLYSEEGNNVELDANPRLFNFRDLIVEHMHDHRLVVRSRKREDYVTLSSRCSLVRDPRGVREETDADVAEVEAIERVEGILKTSIPDNETREALLMTIGCFLLRYDIMQANREFVVLLGSQGTSKSLLLFLAQQLGGTYTSLPASNHMTESGDLSRKALTDNAKRLHLAHEFSKINPMLLKQVWAATDMADTRGCHAGCLDSVPETSKLLLAAQNYEDVQPVQGSDVADRANFIAELDVDGGRVFGKGCKTQALLDETGAKEGRFVIDPHVRDFLKTEAGCTAIAQLFLLRADKAPPDMRASTAFPARVTDVKKYLHLLRGNGDKHIAKYEGIGYNPVVPPVVPSVVPSVASTVEDPYDPNSVEATLRYYVGLAMDNLERSAGQIVSLKVRTTDPLPMPQGVKSDTRLLFT